VSLDDSALERHFMLSREANPHVRRNSVPVMQIVQMSTPPPRTVAQEQQQIKQLKDLGFEQHRLTDGGAIWLAFHEQAEDAGLDEISCC